MPVALVSTGGTSSLPPFTISATKVNEYYATGASSKDEYFLAESLFMVLILQQQKMINKLIAKVSIMYVGNT
jgi:hypothetical protein